MKRIIMVSVAAMFGAAAYTAPPTAPLTVSVDGVRWDGPLYVSVQTEAQFMQEAAAAGTIVHAPEPGSHSFTFDVPPGAYAVSIWHDDGNGVFDRDERGWPLDGWALSGTLGEGEPGFPGAAVTVGPDGTSVVLNMAYPD